MAPATPRATRSSVLGKRPYRQNSVSAKSLAVSMDDSPAVSLPNTPESSRCVKRMRTMTTEVHDSTGNKENIPPFEFEDDPFSSPLSSRSLRRTNSEATVRSVQRTPVVRSGSSANVSAAGASLSVSSLTLQTPPATPRTNLPLHKRARALLRATCNNTGELYGRTSEAATLRNFIMTFIHGKAKKDSHSALYISGSPGCGKTALVNSLLASLEDDLNARDTRVIFVNCMALNNLEAVWDRIITDFGRPKKRGKQLTGCEAVEDIFVASKSKCIVILDEVDHVTGSSQALAKLLGVSHRCSSTLRILAIANTHTLTSSTAQLSVAGVTGAKTLHFSPYDSSQLVDILNSRLRSLSDSAADEGQVKKFLPPATLKLLSMKIASQTGDVRAVFEVLRRAIDIAVGQSKSGTDVSPTVTPAHIQAALKAYSPSSGSAVALTSQGASGSQRSGEMVAKVRNLGLHARLALLALVLASRRVEGGLSVAGSRSQSSSPSTPRSLKRATSSTSIPVESTSIDANQLHALYTDMLTRGENDIFTPVQRNEFVDLLNVLETVGIIVRPAMTHTTPKRRLVRTQSFGGASSKAQEVAFAEGVRASEILRSLGIAEEGDATPPAERLEEEVLSIWDREAKRIRKERDASSKKTAVSSVNPFADAEEN